MLLVRILALSVALQICLFACSKNVDVPKKDSSAPAADAHEMPMEMTDGGLPGAGELLPEKAQIVWEPWLGDFEGMVERRVVRVVVPYGGYQFFYERGRPRGATYSLMQRLEAHINRQLGRRNVKVYVLVIPVSRDRLLPALLAGNADLAAGDLTITADRSSMVNFARPMLTDINEVIVTGPAAPPIESLDDLAGLPVFVRASSSYREHLDRLAADMASRSIDPPIVSPASELLETEDILEMVNAGMVSMTILDDYKARFWAQVFPDIAVRDDLVVNESGAIAWAFRKDSPQLADVLRGFLRKYGKGTLVGNDTYGRYLSDAKRVRCANVKFDTAYQQKLTSLFRTYGERYDFEWLMLAAQAYQESGLRQSRKSPAGAVGVMQIKPSTAADANVGIVDVSTEDANIHAGTKYMRFIADRYFDTPEIDPLNQWLFSLAAYNAGPARIGRFRNEAEQTGYDPNTWFDNVEIIAAKRIGRETVTYVSNTYKYYLGYKLVAERNTRIGETFGDVLAGCQS